MALYETQYLLAEGQTFYKGKVRDVYILENLFISVASDRISAFDHILPQPIPYKGQVLNQVAVHFLETCSDIIPNWFVDTPDPNVSVGVVCEPVRIEMVIRGYLAGHAWRLYSAGERSICGVLMPEGMREGDAFPEPIITPATKAPEGHDEDISREEIIKKGLVAPNHYEEMEAATRALYHRGQLMAEERGLILVDTKYEFGTYDGTLYLMDEIHTPDSSRYYYRDGFEERQRQGVPQEQLSKEFVREWLMAHGFQGKPGQDMPEMPEDFVHAVSQRYIQLYELITGKKFIRESVDDIHQRVHENIVSYLESRSFVR